MALSLPVPVMADAACQAKSECAEAKAKSECAAVKAKPECTGEAKQKAVRKGDRKSRRDRQAKCADKVECKAEQKQEAAGAAKVE